MSIFVDESETFLIEIWWSETVNQQGELVRLDIDDSKHDGWNKIEAQFCQPSGSVFSDILENSTIINHISQKPILRTRALREGVLSKLMKSWVIYVVDKDPISPQINAQTINNIQWKVQNYLFLRYMNETGMGSVVKAATKNDGGLNGR